LTKILESIEFSLDGVSGTIQQIDDLGYRYWRVVIRGAKLITSRNFSSYEAALEAIEVIRVLNSYSGGSLPPANHNI
jgi:hypothetical protein